jgi:glycosyltransferase involved in cell wall biosynthesis
MDHDDSREPEHPENSFVTAARHQGIDVDVISERYAFDFAIINQFRKIVARRAPSVVQTHMVKSHFLTKISGIARKYPWVAYHHGYTTTDLKMRAYNQFNRWSLPSASQVITVCEAFALQLSKAGVKRERISICHNSVESAPGNESPEEGSALRRRLGLSGSEQVALAVGRLSEEKGHVDLIKTLDVLRKSYPGLGPKLLLVGEGPEHDRIETAARATGLSKQLIFVGHTAEVHKYYAIADIVVLPSHSEGSPNVLLEAMAAGLPVVANAVGGIPEIASSGKNALLVAPNDTQSFAQAMGLLLTDRDLAKKLGQSAAQHVRTNFSAVTRARRLLQIYQNVLSQPGIKNQSASPAISG